ERSAPVGASVHDPDPDPDALRYLVVGAPADLPSALTIVSAGAQRGRGGTLSSVPLVDIGCPPGSAPELEYRAAPLIRAVADDVDRTHPLVVDRSIRAEVGGTLSVFASDRKLQSIRVGGPRSTPVGPIQRLRGKLRITVVRDHAKGAPPFGGDD